MATKHPATRPANPRFSSGPCAKIPHFELEMLADAPLGRSHRAKVGKDKALMQIGTLSGNPVAAVAGLKTMEILRRPGQYDRLYAIGERLISAVNEHLGAAGHAHHVSGHSVLFDIVFAEGPIHNYRDVQRGDAAKMARFNAVLREQGIFKGPSKFYPCLALTDDDVDRTVEAIALAAKSLHD